MTAIVLVFLGRLSSFFSAYTTAKALDVFAFWVELKVLFGFARFFPVLLIWWPLLLLSHQKGATLGFSAIQTRCEHDCRTRLYQREWCVRSRS